jgi:ABC-2 type transport system ATP-binding protein
MYAIETFNLSKDFRKEPSLKEFLIHPFRKKERITAVKDINLQIKKGEIFGLLGPNGAGKTTLIKLLCNLIIPTSGRAVVNGYDLYTQEKKIRGSIGLITSDERSFFWRLSGRKNLEFFGSLYDLPSLLIKKRIQELLKLFDLEHKVDFPFKTYSAGMKKKMVIVRSLLHDPEILFMDEPTNSLDPISAQILKELVREKLIKDKGKTIFWATHRLEEVNGLCDRVALMNRAKIEFIGTLNEFKNILKKNDQCVMRLVNLNGEFIKILKKFSNLRPDIISRNHEEVVIELQKTGNESRISDFMTEILNSGGRIKSYGLREHSLEDIFTSLVLKDRKVV